MSVLTEDLERLISFPRVRELNGRIRILKSNYSYETTLLA